MICQRFGKTIVVCALIALSVSCRVKRDFIITDEYVDKETGGKTDKPAPVRLTDKDKKYFADKLGVPAAQITNDELYLSVKKVEATNTTNSAAVAKQVYADAYGKKLKGEAIDMFEDKRMELFKDTGSLREGDLLFFRIGTEDIISHVGVYLKNKKFLSSQDSKAKIFELKSGKWKNSFVTAGRLKQ